MTQAIDQDLAPIVTTSYGLCEAAQGANYMRDMNAVFKQANTQGQTVLRRQAMPAPPTAMTNRLPPRRFRGLPSISQQVRPMSPALVAPSSTAMSRRPAQVPPGPPPHTGLEPPAPTRSTPRSPISRRRHGTMRPCLAITRLAGAAADPAPSSASLPGSSSSLSMAWPTIDRTSRRRARCARHRTRRVA